MQIVVKKRLQIFALVLVALLLGIQFGLWFSSTGIRHLWVIEEQLVAQQEENQLQKLKNQELEAEVENLRNRLEAIDERARSELGLIGENETFFQVIEPENNENAQNNTPESKLE